MSYWIIHYSTDVVFLWSWWKEIRIPYSDLERTLPQQCVAWIKEHEITTLIAVNWPWWFTALRIWSLTLETVKQFYDWNLEIYELSKIELYAMAIEKWLLPPCGLIWIGQRKKAWLTCREWKNVSSTLVSSDILIDEINWKDYFIDYIENHLLKDVLEPSMMVSFSSESTWISLHYKWKEINLSYEELMISWPVEEVVPLYMIEPTLS